LDLALLDALEDVLERDLAAGAAGLRLVAKADRALVGLLAGAAIVLDDARELAGVGDAVEAEDLDRVARHGGVDALAGVVAHRPDLAPVRAGHERVADLQGAALDEQRHDGPAPRIELGLDDDAARGRVGVGLELLELGDDEDRVEEVLEPLLGLGRHVDELGVATPLRGLQVELRHLRAHARRIGALLVDLVDGDEDRDVGGAGVVDRLAGLRHDAVVGGHHDDRDVRDLAAAGAHGGECLVARGVEEGDRLLTVVDLVGADVLGDATGLARGDLGLADGVQQRRLAVVDVAHDRDDRRALDEILVGVLEDRLVLGLVVGVDDLDLLAELLGQDGDRLVGERLREGDHLPHAHELLDDVGDGDAEVLGDIADRRARVDADDVGAAERVLLERRGDLFEHLAAATAAAAASGPAAGRASAGRATGATGAAGTARALAPRGLRVDDDAPASAAGAALVAHAAARGA
jgi:hypothetical protein